jgi:hypothetical protein
MILDQHINTDVVAAMSEPFQFDHVFLFSHGWWTNAIRALEGYNRFTIEYSRSFRSLPKLALLPTLNIGIHWPSTLTEDEVSVVNYFQALSFYTMEHRADSIGDNAAYTLLRLILDAAAKRKQPLRLHLVGHSFGAKVVCSAMSRLLEQAETNPLPAGVTFDVVLLQAAFDNDELDPANDYGKLAKAANVRVLVTRSDGDEALGTLYPTAHRLARLVGKIKPALGASGPSAGVVAAFGGAQQVTVNRGDAPAPGSLLGQRMVVADLSPLHAANPGGVVKFSGHHSDMFYKEIYALMTAFFKLP